jgi:hypothetical protein
MNKKQAEDLIFEIQLACPSLDYCGLYSPKELKMKFAPRLDTKTRRKILGVVSGFGQKMKEEKGFTVIYEAQSQED